MKARNGTRYCTECGHKLHSNGTTRDGKPRLRCRNCGTSRVIRRDDVRLRNELNGIIHLLTCKWTFSEYGKLSGVSRRTISRQLHDCIAKLEVKPPEPTGEVYNCLIVDATWLSHGAVAIARTPRYVQQWEFIDGSEGIKLWLALFRKIPRPDCIVCDGHKGLIAAAKRTYGNDVMLQRCIFHLCHTLHSYLPMTARHPAATELRDYYKQVNYVRTKGQARQFEEHFYELYDKYRDYIDEHTMMTTPSNQVMPDYIHRKTHAAYALLDNLIKDKQLFNYIDHPELNIPNTTNLLEGGVNSRIAELLKCHRGLSIVGQRWVINLYLWTRTEFKKPPFKLKKES